MCIRDRIESLEQQLFEMRGEKQGQGLVHIRSAIMDSIEPVSYTHLDVYKRQAFDFATDNFGLSLMRQETVNGVYYNDLTLSLIHI